MGFSWSINKYCYVYIFLEYESVNVLKYDIFYIEYLSSQWKFKFSAQVYYTYETKNSEKGKHCRFYLFNNFGISSKEKFNVKLTPYIREKIVFSKARKEYIS